MINYRKLGEHVYRILVSYKDFNIPVHFKFVNSIEFQNGEVLDLSFEKLTLVLKEFKQGIKPILLEEIDPKTIKPYVKKEKDGATN